MINFFSKRLLNGILALFTVIILISALIYASPVDPARLTFGQNLDETTLRLKKEQLGLDLPLHKQVMRYIIDLSPVNYISKTDSRLEDYEYYSLLDVDQAGTD